MNMCKQETRAALPEDMDKLKSLWIECFGDTPEYADYIFSGLIRPERSLVCALSGEISAMLFFEPFTLRAGENYRGAYIYGVATAVKYRNMGLSTGLLEFAQGYLSENGYSLSILVPAESSLFNFYAKKGYVAFSDICKISISGADIAGAGRDVTLSPARLETLRDMREKYFGDSRGFVSWNAEYLEYIGGECARFGGETLLIEHGGKTGYAVCCRGAEKEKIYIKEMALPCKTGEELFMPVMRAIHQRYGAAGYECRLRADFNRRDAGPNCSAAPAGSGFISSFAQSLLPYSMIKWYDKGKAEFFGKAPAYIAFVLD